MCKRTRTVSTSHHYALFFIICIMLGGLNSIQCQTFTAKGEENIPAPIARQLRADAARITLRQAQDPTNLPIEIYSKEFTIYYDLLRRIYKQSEIARALADCQVTTSSFPSVDFLKIKYNRSASWASDLQAGISSTSSAIINSLVEKYELIIGDHQIVDQGSGFFTLQAVEPINMTALSNELNGVEGILKIDFGENRKNNSDILINEVGAMWEVIYRFDFKEEKTAQTHQWVFKVDRLGNVLSDLESGAPIPEWMNCY